MVKDREVWRAAVRGVTKVGHDLLTEQQEKPGMDSVSDLNFAYPITEALAQATI